MSSATETLSKPEEIYQRAKLTAKQKKKTPNHVFYGFWRYITSNENIQSHIPSEHVKTKTQRG
jgi:hypothetical protein